jgi:hypothetical protein
MCCAYLASSWSIAFDPRQPGARTRMRQCESSLGADLENFALDIKEQHKFWSEGRGVTTYAGLLAIALVYGRPIIVIRLHEDTALHVKEPDGVFPCVMMPTSERGVFGRTSYHPAGPFAPIVLFFTDSMGGHYLPGWPTHSTLVPRIIGVAEGLPVEGGGPDPLTVESLAQGDTRHGLPLRRKGLLCPQPGCTPAPRQASPL